jgi:hypothetical protein
MYDEHGKRITFQESTATIRQILLQDEPGTVKRRFIERARPAMFRLTEPRLETNGRAAVITGTLPTESLSAHELGRASVDYSHRSLDPQAAFDYDYDAASKMALIVHTGGDSILAEETTHLEYGVAGNTTTWSLPVQAGSTVEVPNVEPGDTIVVAWTGTDGRTVRIGEYTVNKPTSSPQGQVSLRSGPDLGGKAHVAREGSRK